MALPSGVFVPCAAVCALSLLSGCGFGSLGIADAASGNSNTNTVTRTPTELTVVTPLNGESGRVLLELVPGVDRRESLELVSVEYSITGANGVFRPATPAVGFPAEIALGDVLAGEVLAARADRFFTFVWNSHADFDPLLRDATVSAAVSSRTVLRVVVRNVTTGQALTRTTDEFYLNQSLLETVAGGGAGDGFAPQFASFLDPVGVSMGVPGEFYVADAGNNRIRRVTFDGAQATAIETAVGNGFAGAQPFVQPATLTNLSAPRALAADSRGNLFFAEQLSAGSSQIRYFERATGLVFSFLGGFVDVSSLSLLPGKRLYVADEGAGRVWSVDLEGFEPNLDMPAQPVTELVGTFAGPAAVLALEEEGATVLFVAERATGVIFRKLGAGAPSRFAGGGANVPAIGLSGLDLNLVGVSALSVDAANLYVAQSDPDPQTPPELPSRLVALRRQTTAREVVNVVDQVPTPGGPAASRALRRPSGLARSALGTLWVVEGDPGASGPGGHRIVAVSAPADPAAVAVAEVVAGESSKQPTQGFSGQSRSTLGTTVLQSTLSN